MDFKNFAHDFITLAEAYLILGRLLNFVADYLTRAGWQELLQVTTKEVLQVGLETLPAI